MNFGFYAKVAFRNIFRQKKRTFSLGINYAIVTLILLLVFAFSHGASRNISTSLSRATSGHINIIGDYVIEGKLYKGVLEYPKIESIVRDTLGQDTVIYPRYNVWTITYNKGIPKRVRYYGIYPELESDIQEQFDFIEGSWEDFANNPDGIILAKSLVEYLELEPQSEVVVSTRTRFGAFNTTTFVLRGVFETDNYFIENLAIAHFDTIRELDLANEGSASVLAIFVRDLNKIDRDRDRVVTAMQDAGFDAAKPESASDAVSATSSASPTYKVEPGQEDTVTFTVATLDEVLGFVGAIVTAIDAVGGFLAALMLFVIVIAIFINLKMTISDRMQEIGTMRTIGLEAKGVVSLFVLENIFLAIMFVCIGIAVGFGVMALFVYAIELPVRGAFSLLLNNGRLALSPQGSDIVLILIAISAFAAIFSYIPSRRAGKIPPAEALRKTM
ncbi:MAG: ABC transporter permease [Spirochaetota bacterium]|nr:MAG: ABC transporter permease [Spirochaetota bacterium]